MLDAPTLRTSAPPYSQATPECGKGNFIDMMSKSPLRVLSVFGTRPEAIKMAPVVNALSQEPEHFESRVCVTAQHREMLDQVLSLFGIAPHWDLDLMRPGQTLTSLTQQVLVGLGAVFDTWRPDVVLVHGDTTTSFAAALASFYARISVGHVEAGLRTWNKHSPWPEEMNRQLTGRLADLHFAPTEQARRNLLAEGIPDGHILVTGNTVIDALMDVSQRLENMWQPDERHRFFEQRKSAGRRLILVTGHRRENFGEGLSNVCGALQQIAESGSVDVCYPVHPNPSVSGPVRQALGGVPSIHLIEPLDYLPFVALLKLCDLVITDSGGIQEEAPSLGKPVLVTRLNTERPEAVDAGTVKLVGTDRATIVNQTMTLLHDQRAYDEMSTRSNPYGSGTAACMIADALRTRVRASGWTT